MDVKDVLLRWFINLNKEASTKGIKKENISNKKLAN